MFLFHLFHVLAPWHVYAHHCHAIVTGPIIKGQKPHLVCPKPGHIYPL